MNWIFTYYFYQPTRYKLHHYFNVGVLNRHMWSWLYFRKRARATFIAGCRSCSDGRDQRRCRVECQLLKVHWQSFVHHSSLRCVIPPFGHDSIVKEAIKGPVFQEKLFVIEVIQLVPWQAQTRKLAHLFKSRSRFWGTYFLISFFFKIHSATS